MTKVTYIEFADHVREALRNASPSPKHIKALARKAGIRTAALKNFAAGFSLPEREIERLAGALDLALTWRGRLAIEHKAKGES